MTSTRYLIERIAQVFGFSRKTQRLSDAANEMHLLREAEAHLGEAVWNKVEKIEELSQEYWSLRKLAKEKEELGKRLEACHKRLDKANEERTRLLEERARSGDAELLVRRKELLAELEGLARQRDEIIREGRTVRRHYNGAITKLEVIGSEEGHDPKELREIEAQLEQLRGRFSELKQSRDEVAAKILEGDARLDEINAKLKEESLENEKVASEAFLLINQVNKEVWQLHAESGLIDTRMHQLFIEIGRHVSRNTAADRNCAAAASSHQGLIDVMRALRRSIALNHKLAGTI